MSDPFDARGKSLEDAWFSKANDEAIQRLKEKTARADSRKDIEALTGITDPQVLDALAGLGIGGAAVLAMSYYPMVAVAWADGTVEPEERAAILQAVEGMGVAEGDPARDYLEKWLSEKPEPTWMRVWTDYVRALCEKMKPEEIALLRNTVVGRARTVAEAAGGILGALWKVSQAEKRVINELEAAFR